MKSLPSDPVIHRIIEEIPRQRVTDVFHMDPDLVGPPGFQMKLYKGKSCVLKAVNSLPVKVWSE
jgi:hypothetical protein